MVCTSTTSTAQSGRDQRNTMVVDTCPLWCAGCCFVSFRWVPRATPRQRVYPLQRIPLERSQNERPKRAQKNLPCSAGAFSLKNIGRSFAEAHELINTKRARDVTLPHVYHTISRSLITKISADSYYRFFRVQMCVSIDASLGPAILIF